MLVWQDMAGLHTGDRPPAKFVKAYADLSGILGTAARTFADEVRSGAYPAPEHSFS